MGDGEERKQKECGKGDRLSTDFLHAPTEALLPRNIIIQAAYFNPLNAELNPISYLLALLGAHHFPHVSRIRVKSLTLRLLTSYIYIYIYIYIYDVSSLRVKDPTETSRKLARFKASAEV